MHLTNKVIILNLIYYTTHSNLLLIALTFTQIYNSIATGGAFATNEAISAMYLRSTSETKILSFSKSRFTSLISNTPSKYLFQIGMAVALLLSTTPSVWAWISSTVYAGMLGQKSSVDSVSFSDSNWKLIHAIYQPQVLVLGCLVNLWDLTIPSLLSYYWPRTKQLFPAYRGFVVFTSNIVEPLMSNRIFSLFRPITNSVSASNAQWPLFYIFYFQYYLLLFYICIQLSFNCLTAFSPSRFYNTILVSSKMNIYELRHEMFIFLGI